MYVCTYICIYHMYNTIQQLHLRIELILIIYRSIEFTSNVPLSNIIIQVGFFSAWCFIFIFSLLIETTFFIQLFFNLFSDILDCLAFPYITTVYLWCSVQMVLYIYLFGNKTISLMKSIAYSLIMKLSWFVVL